MHYHLVATDGVHTTPAIRTIATAADAEREALRTAMLHGDWAPKRYPGRTWKRGEIAVYLDRSSRVDRPPNRRALSIVRCLAASDAAHDCVPRSLGVPALNLAPTVPHEAPQPSAQSGRQRPG